MAHTKNMQEKTGGTEGKLIEGKEEAKMLVERRDQGGHREAKTGVQRAQAGQGGNEKRQA